MRKEIGIFDEFKLTLDKLLGDGILLVAGNPPNPMTIGWGTIGIVWGKPVFTVFVRPTRFTYDRMEHSDSFSVNLLPDSFIRQLSVCGTESGRDTDKIEVCGFTMENGIRIPAKFIGESWIHYECKIIHKHTIDQETLETSLIRRYYPIRDFHRAYYGEIVGVYKTEGR